MRALRGGSFRYAFVPLRQLGSSRAVAAFSRAAQHSPRKRGGNASKCVSPISEEAESPSVASVPSSKRTSRQKESYRSPPPIPPELIGQSEAPWKWVHAVRVHQRVRALLVQLVLLAAHPYTPDVLIEELATSAVDPTTRYLCEWAGYAMQMFSTSHQHRPLAHHGDRRETELQAALEVGNAFTTLYARSILPVHRELPNAGLAACVPGETDVLRWMALGVILSDPLFRISAFGGFVCYPCQPSILLPTWDVVDNPRRLNAVLTATRVTRKGGLEAPHSDCSAGDAVVDPSATFVKINYADGSGHRRASWSHARSLFHTLDVLIESSITDAELRREVTAMARPPRGDAGPSAQSLTQLWIRNFDQPSAPYDLLGCAAQHVVDGANPPPTHTRASGSSHGVGTSWREAHGEGHTVLRMWVHEATEGSFRRLIVDQLPQQHPSTGVMQHINLRLCAPLCESLLGTPISVMRLAMLLRWNASVPFAGMYNHSLLYFLLVFAGNPTVLRMQKRVTSRRQTARLLVQLWKEAKGHDAGRRSWLLSRRESRGGSGAVIYASQRNRVGADSGGGAQSEEEAAGALHELAMSEEAAMCEGVRAGAAVVRLMFARVLPWRRLGAGRGGGLGEGRGDGNGSAECASFAGQALRHIEVLATDTLTPRETVELLRQRYVSAMAAGGDGGGISGVVWITQEEEYVLCFPITHAVLEGRVTALAQAWLEAEGRQVKGGISIAELCRLCLWTHEYGVGMAAELMFAYLSFFPDVVQVSPPPPTCVSETPGETILADWVVTFPHAIPHK